jgi:hypothetical protein
MKPYLHKSSFFSSQKIKNNTTKISILFNQN